MNFLSTKDISALLGHGPKAIKTEAKVCRQGNGKFTGMVVTTYDDGKEGIWEFIKNAATVADVRAAYMTRNG